MAEPTSGWTAYADGSCLGNPGRGGWGVVLIAPGGTTTEFAGADPATTNNRMEITAAIEALRRIPPDAPILIRSDSQYVIKTMTMGWRRRENLDLWAPLDQEVARRRVRWEWVRGHNGDRLNERADELARSAAEGRPARRDPAATVSAAQPAPRGEGSSPPPVRLAAEPEPDARMNSDRASVTRLTPMLCAGEDIRHCRGCRRLFVARANEYFCTLVSCQLKSRTAQPS